LARPEPVHGRRAGARGLHPVATPAPTTAPTTAPATQAPGATVAPTQPPAPTTAPTEAPTAAPSKPKVVTITFAQEQDSLNPMYTSMWFSYITEAFWLRGLWRFDDKGKAVPDIAAEIPTEANGGIADGGKTITVKLNPDAKWSDGEPLTADDFVFTYQMIISDKNKVSTTYPYKDQVASVEAQDPQTLVVKFNDPFAPWITSVFATAPNSIPVIPKHILEPVFQKDGTLDNAEWNRAPTVSAGPFVFKEWESGSQMTFVRNDHWFGPKPKVDQIFFRIVPDDAAQMAAIKSGDTDIGVYLTFADVSDVEGSGVAEMASDQGGWAESWFLNFDPKRSHPAMRDVKVRQALALATDCEKITKDLLGGKTTPLGTFWDATPPFSDSSIKPDPYDPDQAAKLLDEAGWKLGADGIREKTIGGKVVKLKLRYITNSKDLRKQVMAVVKQMWAKVGIDVELVNYANDVYFNSYAQNGPQYVDNFDIAEFSQDPSFPDPDISQFLCSEIPTPDHPEGNNFQGYCNKDLDKLFAQQATTVNRDDRIKIFYQIEKIMHDDMVWIGMWNDLDLWSVNKRLKNVVFSGGTSFWNVTDWDITQ
jgi:peptide/nickel transport system substrate-binding protein